MPLTENEVIDAVTKHLEVNGWKIVAKLTTSQQGTDIIADHPLPPRRLHVEAKGGTSSKKHTERFGKPFHGGQVKSHVSVAFYYAARLQEKHPADEVALAFPDDIQHRAAIEAISTALAKLRIGVYFVDDDRSVCLTS